MFLINVKVMERMDGERVVAADAVDCSVGRRAVALRLFFMLVDYFLCQPVTASGTASVEAK
jgi:hypothetical protein